MGMTIVTSQPIHIGRLSKLIIVPRAQPLIIAAVLMEVQVVFKSSCVEDPVVEFTFYQVANLTCCKNRPVSVIDEF